MSAHSYNPTAKVRHSLMAALRIVAWFVGVAAVYMREAWKPHDDLTITHKTLASTLLFLIVVGWHGA